MLPDAKRVREIVFDCLYRDEEVEGLTEAPADAVLVEGVRLRLGLHPQRVAGHADEIVKNLQALPDTFQQDGGEGMSFLSACNNRDGEQWGEHNDIDHLLVLGLAIKRVAYCMPRDMWRALPGGVPYFVVLNAPATLEDPAC